MAAHPAVVAAGSWAAIWSVLTVTGQGFALRTLYAGYQFAPADAAYDDPFATVWNLHIQPPLWNLWVAAVGAWSPLGLATSHRLAALVFGVVLAWSLCETLRLLGATAGVAVALTLLATANTHVLKHAFEPRYDFAVAALVSVLVWSVARLRGGDTPRWPVALPIMVATTIVLIRTLYHPLWLVIVAALVVWALRGRAIRREAVVACVVAIVAIGGWMVKNAAEFDRFTMSTWTGMNLLRSTSPAVDEQRLADLSERGTISTIWRVGVPAYAYATTCADAGGADPVLDSPTRPLPAEYQSGALDDDIAPNFNARCFLPAYDQAGADFRALLRAEPGAWARGRVWAVNNWFEVPDARVFDASPLWEPLDAVTRVVLVGVPHPGLPDGWSDDALWVHETPQSLTLMLASAALLLAAGRRLSLRPRPEDLVVLLAGFVVAYTMIVGVALELGEQSRFRNAIDPIVLAIGGWVVVDWWARRSRGRYSTDDV